MNCRSIFISDTHIGSSHCNHEDLLKFISEIECEYLYLVGDIIDGWALKRNFKWYKNYNTIIQKILRLSRKGCKVFYIYGNHDDFLENFSDTFFGDIYITRSMIHKTSTGNPILVIHGDQFDGIITKYKWIQKIGSFFYDNSLILNKFFRIFKFSFSEFLKRKTKDAAMYIANYEEHVSNYAKQIDCGVVISGHIHSAQDKMINDIRYINCGSWQEGKNTVVIENYDGTFELKFL